jgi:hypothetical protein
MKPVIMLKHDSSKTAGLTIGNTVVALQVDSRIQDGVAVMSMQTAIMIFREVMDGADAMVRFPGGKPRRKRRPRAVNRLGVTREQVQSAIGRLRDSLTPEELYVLKAWFALDEFKVPVVLRVIAKNVNASVGHVKKTRDTALAKLGLGPDPAQLSIPAVDHG